ncbi:FixH family protein [Ancylomarina longa]|uniref:Nitrogen fixation protein FixH n=1 Tax=Ancylomarina longa TaxID=2487017 RepID=A0A434AXW7_9BACT|nr:FixH family protein [Ancylomarina longa]RUT79396.1 hypothetical protein DLK05_04035 [Ancylomarina longa]
MKKLNWGTKLGFVASIYVIGILGFVGFSTTQNINLVSKNYYPKEVKYQDQIDKIKNSKELKVPVTVSQEAGKIQIQFPEGMRSNIEGNIIFYRPADSNQDLQYKIALDENGIQTVDSKNMHQGRYTVKIDWVYKNIPYYKEEGIYLAK